MNDRPGYLTSEFWSTVLMAAVTILVTVFNLPRDQAQTFSGAVPVLAAVVVQGILSWKYIHGRQELKQGTAPDDAIAGKVG